MSKKKCHHITKTFPTVLFLSTPNPVFTLGAQHPSIWRALHGAAVWLRVVHGVLPPRQPRLEAPQYRRARPVPQRCRRPLLPAMRSVTQIFPPHVLGYFYSRANCDCFEQITTFVVPRLLCVISPSATRWCLTQYSKCKRRRMKAGSISSLAPTNVKLCIKGLSITERNNDEAQSTNIDPIQNMSSSFPIFFVELSSLALIQLACYLRRFKGRLNYAFAPWW